MNYNTLAVFPEITLQHFENIFVNSKTIELKTNPKKCELYFYLLIRNLWQENSLCHLMEPR